VGIPQEQLQQDTGVDMVLSMDLEEEVLVAKVCPRGPHP
jgi:hypothetical protein